MKYHIEKNTIQETLVIGPGRCETTWLIIPRRLW